MKEKYLKSREKLFVFMGYAKQYLKDFVEDPIIVANKLYNMGDPISVELAQNIETEIYIMDKIEEEDPDIFS
jgi:hypothetical protein